MKARWIIGLFIFLTSGANADPFVDRMRNVYEEKISLIWEFDTQAKMCLARHTRGDWFPSMSGPCKAMESLYKQLMMTVSESDINRYAKIKGINNGIGKVMQRVAHQGLEKYHMIHNM